MLIYLLFSFLLARQRKNTTALPPLRRGDNEDNGLGEGWERYRKREPVVSKPNGWPTRSASVIDAKEFI